MKNRCPRFLLLRTGKNENHRSRAALAAALILLALPGCGGGEEPGPSGGPPIAGLPSAAESVQPFPAVNEPAGELPSSPELLALGKKLYEKNCAACHGLKGDGEGEAAYLLYPKPRVFTDGKFAIVSTWDRIPTDRDLFRTISRGMPGSAMPSWNHLAERERWSLVHYLKRFSRQPLEIQAAAEPPEPGGTGRGVIQVPPEPAWDAAARQRAAYLFREACASCHGPTGRGDGVARQIDEWGYRTRPRDLTLGIFKAKPAPEEIYRRIVAGLPGTPMPMSSWAYGQDAWHLVHYVLEMSGEAQRQKVEMRRFPIPAVRVEEVPDHPDSGVWRQAPAAVLHLMPLWWRNDRPENLTVRAVHDGEQIGFLLQWSDPTHDHTAIRPQDFRDAAAVQLSLTDDPPLFAMGQAGNFVNIWMWKSERQADLEPAFQDLDKIYPNIGIDSYPNLQKAPYEQPTRHALTLDSDPAFITAWGAGNIVADPTRDSSAESLVAQGFGTLQARPELEQDLEAKGVYGMGSYRVTFRRKLAGGGQRSARLRPGDAVPIAFAVWDGSAGDRDGKKSVTIWQELRLAP